MLEESPFLAETVKEEDLKTIIQYWTLGLTVVTAIISIWVWVILSNQNNDLLLQNKRLIKTHREVVKKIDEILKPVQENLSWYEQGQIVEGNNIVTWKQITIWTSWDVKKLRDVLQVYSMIDEKKE